MPAVRSRTENWHRSLEQLCERNGSLEIAVARHHDEQADGGGGTHLIWRVRLLRLDDNGIVVEQPSSLGQTIRLAEGLELVAMMSIGQNRWMFRTHLLEKVPHQLNDRMKLIALQLAWPKKVERCQRRAFYRVSTVTLSLPDVEVYPLLDPGSVWQAEQDSRARMAISQEALLGGQQLPDPRPVLPEVGPGLTAKLVNLGGGGAGLQVGPEHNGLMNTHRQYWLQLTLPPIILTPFGVQARLAHTHVDSLHNIYAGMQFEFSQTPGYKDFVVEQVCKYVTEAQREQLRRRREDIEGDH